MPKKQIKPFLTYTEQLTKLTEDKKLLIPDSVYAQNALTNISYYRKSRKSFRLPAF